MVALQHFLTCAGDSYNSYSEGLFSQAQKRVRNAVVSLDAAWVERMKCKLLTPGGFPAGTKLTLSLDPKQVTKQCVEGDSITEDEWKEMSR